MSALPFDSDVAENETALKFAMNVNNLYSGRLDAHMEKLSLTCLKILTDTRVIKDIDEPFKVLTVKFIKNVIMQKEVDQQRLAMLEGQMSEYEREQL
jgi:hypothetical protein